MIKKKHKTRTPGPWHTSVNWDTKFRVSDEADRVIVETRPPGNINSSGNEEGNAYLCAAAPDLLAALERLLDERDPFHSDTESCECGENGSGFDDGGNPCEHIQARRAIAKAKGE